MAVAAYGVSKVTQYVPPLPLASLRDREQAGSGDFAVAAAVGRLQSHNRTVASYGDAPAPAARSLGVV
jgi:hypothetical protein